QRGTFCTRQLHPWHWINSALDLFGLLRFRRHAAPRRPVAVKDMAASESPATRDAGDIRSIEARPPDAVLRVVYASQTGFAEQLARQTSQSLQLAGLPTR